MYKARGFNIDIFHEDNKFNLNALIEHIRPAGLNICAKGENIPIIKSSIQTSNQGAQCATHSVPYKRCMNIMTSSLVEFIIYSRNSFPQRVASARD